MKVRVYSDYSPIKIVNGEDLDKVSNSAGLTGAYIEIDNSMLPEDRIHRDFWKVVDGAVVVGDPTQEWIRSKFDIVLFQTDLANLLPSLSSPMLRWEFAALNTYAQNKDFEGMAGYLGMLVGAEAATQNDMDAVIALLTKQGIVL